MNYWKVSLDNFEDLKLCLGQEQNHMTGDSKDVSIRKIQDPLSCVSLRISMYFNEERLATGTAFIYLYEEKPYLITNWHNVSGREPSTLKAKHPACAIPNRIFVEVPFINHKTSSIIWEEHQVPIYQDDGDSPSKSIWYEHPLHRYKVDVVAIPVHEDEVFSPLKSIWHTIQSAQKRPEPIESSIENIICPATAPCLNLSLVKFNPGQGVFVLGFPEGMTGGANFPVWKRGSIASEPYLDIDDLPKIFVVQRLVQECQVLLFMFTKRDDGKRKRDAGLKNQMDHLLGYKEDVSLESTLGELVMIRFRLSWVLFGNMML